MGLDTTHNCWHGSYISFGEFRHTLADAAGYYADNSHVSELKRVIRENPDCYAGEWQTVETDPLMYLIAHSDCDGVLHPAQAAPLADRIEALIPRLSGWYARAARQFVVGLRAAVAAGEDVAFR